MDFLPLLGAEEFSGKENKGQQSGASDDVPWREGLCPGWVLEPLKTQKSRD